jgi:hypothetical protein
MRLAVALVLSAVASTGCLSKLTEKTAFKSTSAILARASAGMQMESDYELAKYAIPASLKTVEGFYVAGPPDAGRDRLVRILTEGYCQYGTAFVEDDWEAAKLVKDLAEVDVTNTRANHVFTRCLNYSLGTLGPKWQKAIFGTPDELAAMLKTAGKSQRFALMFAGTALGSLINHNLTRVEMIAMLPNVELIMNRIIEIDKGGLPVDPEGSYYEGKVNLAHAAQPYIALGMIHSARGKAMGGDPDKAKAYFEEALKLTSDKFLLARTNMAVRVGMATNDRKFFHDQLKIVLETSPSVWPEQRLANEFAQRKARRYLAKEKELFQ